MPQDSYKQNVVNILTRLREYLNLQSDADLARKLGVSPNALSNWKRRNTFDTDSIFTFCVDNLIDIDWLITGEGRPHKAGHSERIEESPTVYSHGEKKVENQAIPVYDIRATAGIEGVFNGNKSIPIDTIQIPNLPKCDGAIFATGDSMYPLIKSGDILMFKQVENSIENVFFGEMYIVAMDLAGDEYLAVKWVQKSEKGDKYIKLVSENQHHQPKDVKLKDVKALALIKAHTRIYTMR